MSDIKMNLSDFKKLSAEKKVQYINDRADGEMSLRDIEKKYFNFANLSKYVDNELYKWDRNQKKYIKNENRNKKTKNEDAVKLTNEEIIFIKELYKTSKMIDGEKDDKLITRSIRIDEQVINDFALYCKRNNYKQSIALKIALNNFMNK